MSGVCLASVDKTRTLIMDWSLQNSGHSFPVSHRSKIFVWSLIGSSTCAWATVVRLPLRLHLSTVCTFFFSFIIYHKISTISRTRKYRCRRNAKTYTPMYKLHLEFHIRSAAKTPHATAACVYMMKLHGVFVSFVLCPATIKWGRSRVVSSAVISPLSLPPLSQSTVRYVH